jgi:hypothetical protein
MLHRSNVAVQQFYEEPTMINKVKEFVTEQTQALAGQAQKLGKAPVETAREAAVKSAAGIKSLKDPIRALARSGVKLTAISQGTAQSLIELQAEMVTTALTEAADQLERAEVRRDERQPGDPRRNGSAGGEKVRRALQVLPEGEADADDKARVGEQDGVVEQG